MRRDVFLVLFTIVATLVFYTALVLNTEYFRNFALMSIRISQQPPVYEASFADIFKLIK